MPDFLVPGTGVLPLGLYGYLPAPECARIVPENEKTGPHGERLLLMISLMAQVLVVSGALTLAWALVPFWSLIDQLPAGNVRRRWYVMVLLIVVFIAGYLGYAGVFWDSHEGMHDLIVPAVFFLGSWFVLLTAKLSLLTAIDVMRVNRLEQETLIDPLTGIFNRRYLDRRLAQEVERALRYRIPLSVLLIDIDHFKQINDGYGHPVGDQVLVCLGKIVAGELRESDVFARYGGEEFMIILPNTPLAGAVDIAERVRLRVHSHVFLPVEPEGMGGINTTVSIGVASLGGTADSADKLVQSADKSLYGAKNAGRNRVMSSLPTTLSTAAL